MLENVAEYPIANNSIEVRVDNIAQLFDTLDPFPFPERDLDRDAEDYIVGWARELDPQKTMRIIVHFPNTPAEVKAATHVSEAFARYFRYRAGVIQRELNELLWIGRRSFAVGFVILILCLIIAQIAAGYISDAAVRRIVEESFLIFGWVANWRPLEIFLYDWWPLARRRDLYRRLSTTTVEMRPRLQT